MEKENPLKNINTESNIKNIFISFTDYHLHSDLDKCRTLKENKKN